MSALHKTLPFGLNNFTKSSYFTTRKITPFFLFTPLEKYLVQYVYILKNTLPTLAAVLCAAIVFLTGLVLGIICTTVLGVHTVHAGVINKPLNNLGLVAYYSFDDASTTKATDLSGNGNTGTLTNGPVPTTGRLGQGLSFDGVDDYVESNSASLAFSNYITVSAWINVAALPQTDSFESIITKYGTNNPNTSGYDLRLQNIGGTQQVLFTGLSAGGSSSDAIVNQTLVEGGWYLLTGTADGTNFNLYINGQLVNSTAGTFTSNSRPFHIGMINFSDAVGPTRFFNGDIDDVRIYNRALSASEISNLYTYGETKLIKTKAINNLGLVGYWSFEDATGTTATDFSGNHNTGTLTNMTNADWVDGKNGKALEFDGVDDYISVPDSNSLDITNEITISMWVNPTVLSDTVLLSKRSITPETTNYQVALANEEIQWFNGSVPAVNSSGANMVANEWALITFTYDNTTIKFYKNGVFFYSAGGSATMTANSYNINIASYNNGAGAFTHGKIDDIRIYNRALSASEITDLFNSSSHAQTVVRTSQADKLTDGLVAYYPMSGKDINGTTLRDRAGSNDGTLTNGPTPVIGKVGQGLSFDGVDDYVIASGPTLDANMTVSVWFKTAGDFGASHRLFDTNVIAPGLNVLLDSTGTLSIDNSGGPSIGISSITTGLDDGQWHLVTTSRNGSTYSLYVDGQYEASGSGSVPTYTGVYIGGYDSSYQLWPGLLDEFRMYNRALSATEVQELYNLGR